MKKWKNHWAELLPYEKKIEVTALLLAGVAGISLVCDVLQTFGAFSLGFDFFMVGKLALTFGLACEAVVFWRKQRNSAVAFTVSAILCLLSVLLDMIRYMIR